MDFNRALARLKDEAPRAIFASTGPDSWLRPHW